MKKTLLLCVLLYMIADLKAQEKTNCWISYDYVLMGNQFGKSGLKKVKGKKATVCFNNRSVALYTYETGVINFNYNEVSREIDSTGKVKWTGFSGDPSNDNYGEWVIDMTYNDKILINHTVTGSWGCQLNKIGHAQYGWREFTNKHHAKKKSVPQR